MVFLVPIFGGGFDLGFVRRLGELSGAGEEPDSVFQILGIFLEVGVAEVVDVEQRRGLGSGSRILIGLELFGIGVDFGFDVFLRRIVGSDGLVEDGGRDVLELVVVGLGGAGVLGSIETLLGDGGGVVELGLVAVGSRMFEVDDGGESAQVIGAGLDEALGGIEHFGRVLGLLIGGHQVLQHVDFGDAVGILLEESLDRLGLGGGSRLAFGVSVGVILRRILDRDLGTVVRGALCGSLAVSALSEGRQGDDRAGTKAEQRNRGNSKILHSTLLGEFV